MAKTVKEWTVGMPHLDDTKMGPLVSQQHLDKVLSYIELARKEGAKIWCGGERLEQKGYFLGPTIISG